MARKHAREDSQSGDWVVDGVEKFKPIYDRYIRPHIELDDLIAGDDDDEDGGDHGAGPASGGEEAPPAFDPRTPTAEQFWNDAAARASEAGGPAARAGRAGAAGVAGVAGDAGQGAGRRAKALGAEDMLKHLVEGSAVPLSRLCKTLDATLDEVSGWIGDRRNRGHIGNLVHLLDAQTQLLMSQHRLAAVARLSQLLRDERASPETARRACSDLLKIQLIEPSESCEEPDVEGSCGESPVRAVIVMPQGGITQAFRDACRESMPADEDADRDDGEGAAHGIPAADESRGASITVEGREARRT